MSSSVNKRTKAPFYTLARCAHDQPLVILQHREPVRDVSGVVAEAGRRLQTNPVDQVAGTQLSTQLLTAVSVAAEVSRVSEPIEAAGMTGAVSQLMEGRAVILRHFTELASQRQHHFVGGGTVKGLVALTVHNPDIATTNVAGDDLFRESVYRSSSRDAGQTTAIPWRDPLALVGVEHGDVTKVRHKFDFARVLIHALQEFEEHDDAALLALADVTTFLAGLLEGQVFIATTSQE